MYGFSNFTVFFEIEGELVNHIWLLICAWVSLVEISVEKFELVKLVQYSLGEESDLILIKICNGCADF